jgi:hypothetical protein
MWDYNDKRLGLENDESSGFESLIVFVTIFTGRTRVKFGKIICNYKSQFTSRMLNVSICLYYCHHHFLGHITSTVIP